MRISPRLSLGDWQDYLLMFLVLIWTASVLLVCLKFGNLVIHADALGFMERASAISLFRLETLVDGLYPLGFPLALRGVASVLTDYAWSARMLSVSAGGLTLILLFQLASRLFDRQTAIIAAILLGSHTAFLAHVCLEGTDILALFFVVLSIYMVLTPPQATFRRSFIGGISLGISYLVRYTALPVLPGMLLAVALLPMGTPLPFRDRLYRSLWFGAGFLIGASPQLFASALLTGNPFFNTQHLNVYLGIHGNADWSNWNNALKYQGLREVILLDPKLFVLTVLRNFQDNLLLAPLSIRFALVSFGWAGFFQSVFHAQPSRRQIAVALLLVLITYVSGISLAFQGQRFLLLPLVIFALWAALAMKAFFKHHQYLLFATLAVVALMQSSSFLYTLIVPSNEYWESRREISMALEQRGVVRERVLAIQEQYYDILSPEKRQYIRAPKILTSESQTDKLTLIVNYMRLKGFEFLLLDQFVLMDTIDRQVMASCFESFIETRFLGARVVRLLPECRSENKELADQHERT